MFVSTKTTNKLFYHIPPESSSFVHVIKGGLALGMSEQRLGRHQYERFAVRQSDLPTEDVEVAGWRRAVSDDPVGVVQLAHWKNTTYYLFPCP